MKKHLTFLAILLFSCVYAMAQNPYYDALKLRSMMIKVETNAATHDSAYFFNTSKITQVYQILKNYSYDSGSNGPANDDGAIDRSICGGAVTNDYLCNYFAGAPAGATAISSVFSTIGSYNGTNLFNGLSQFLIERAKAEVNEAFFIRFKDFLDNYPEFKTLFPNTYIFLSNYNSWEYANLLNTLKEAFNKDINQLPASIILLKDLKVVDCEKVTGDTSKSCQKCKERVTAIKDFFNSNNGRLLLSALKLSDGVLQNQKTPQIINSITTNEFLLGYNGANAAATTNIKNTLQVINIFSLSIESNETGKNYISTDQFNGILKDEVLRNLFLGLIFQKISIANSGTGITFNISGNSVALNSLITPDNVQGLIAYITNFFEQAKNLQHVTDQLKADRLAAKADLSTDFAALTEATRQLLIGLRAIAIIDSRLVIPADVDKFFNHTDRTLQLSNDIFAKHYNAAVMDLLSMLSSYAQSQGTVDNEVTIFFANLLKYGSFAANVVEAKSAEDVKKAVEAMALPVGSYTVKQKSAFNISLNAYVGYAWDFNKLLFKDKYAHGIYAPIGFSFNFGSSKPYGVPVTFFTSIIDLGSFVSYNINKTSTDDLKQEVRLESVFSPSFQIFVQVPKTPITIGGGWRQTPKLFYSSESEPFVPIKSRSVVNIAILIDIPIFTLHNRPFAAAK